MEIYPDAEYFCITRLKHFLSDQFKVISWDEILYEMATHFGFSSTPYNWLNPRTFSDWARFWYLGTHGDTLYLDTDAAMEKPFPFSDKLVYSPGNICLLYAPEDFPRERLLSLQETQARAYVGQLMGLHKRFSYEWSEPIPLEYFRHGA